LYGLLFLGAKIAILSDLFQNERCLFLRFCIIIKTNDKSQSAIGKKTHFSIFNRKMLKSYQLHFYTKKYCPLAQEGSIYKDITTVANLVAF